MEPDVAVGVTVHAQPDLLKATLASLRAAGGPRFALVLLPDGPDAETRTALASIDLPTDGTADARGGAACFNRLAARGGADVVVLLESGSLVGPGWLEALVHALLARRGAGLAGPSTNAATNQQAAFPGPGGSLADVRVVAAMARARFGTRSRSLAPLHGVADFCVAATRVAVDAVGAADDGFGLGPGWELEYGARALRAGFRAVWACGAYVQAPAPTTRRAQAYRGLSEASKRRYQDAICGLRLSGDRTGYQPDCVGTVCPHFAPPDRIRVHRPLEPRGATTAGRPGSATGPLVSCIMPTRDRAEFVRHAVALLGRQDHRNWELIVVDDGDDDLRRRLPDDPRVRYVRAPAGESIGAKRNRACALAAGEIVVHWDDDDWYAPGRLRRQVAPLLDGSADITALRTGTILDLDAWGWWRPSDELHRMMFVEDVHGGTLAYRRSVWHEARFPEVSLAEDAAFLRAALRRGARLRRLDNDGLFIYVRHGESAWRFACGSFLDPRGWRRTLEPPLPDGDRRFLAARSAQAPAGALPLISCVMPTADRRALIPRAIRHFQRQDHPARELVILDDGNDPIGDLVPADPRIRYQASARRLVLGAKRNALCEAARGSLIVHWDDDDWSAPHRLRYQLRELARSGADVSGAASQLYLDPRVPRAWRYTHPAPERARWAAGNTLCYTVERWRRNPFPELAIGEDSRFLDGDRQQRLHILPDWRFVVGLIHGRNASPKRTDSAWWHPVPVAEVQRALGDDAASYLPIATR